MILLIPTQLLTRLNLGHFADRKVNIWYNSMQENVYKIRNCLFHKTSTERQCYAEHSTKIVRFASVFFRGGGVKTYTAECTTVCFAHAIGNTS